jgi:hypothetical protein
MGIFPKHVNPSSMKHIYPFPHKPLNYLIVTVLVGILSVYGNQALGQTCPGNSLSTISTFPNTYYPGASVSLAAGTKSITLGAAPYGTTPISTGDVLLIMQMQGAQYVATNSASYGFGGGTLGTGYLTNANLYVGNMEYVVAANSVPLTGGALTLKSGLVHPYRDTAFNAAGDGQYTYQIIRVPMYYDLKLTGPITAPFWNGSSGGVVVLYAADSINFNGQTVSASGVGFRGGAYYAMAGGAGLNTDFQNLGTNTTDAYKGEGISGTPRFMYYNSTVVDNQVEGYPGGAVGRGAPGNAGGGGTDGHPSANDQNTGGGGGGNGGIGGGGGNGWSSASTTGGRGGYLYLSVSPSKVVLGGGGGSGTTNNGTGVPAGGWASGGASGGGIVIVMANTGFSGTGTIDVSGANGNITVLNDGSGGGGAGGSAIIYAGNSGLGLSNITVNANGGNGGSNTGAGASHGPGGGGGGGVIYANNTLNAASSVNGGIAGTTAGGINYGAIAGNPGNITQNMTQAQMSTFPITCSVLGVNFISIAAQPQDGQVKLEWTVGNESNVSEYQVEKSLDGQTFNPIGSIAYKASNSNINQYSFIDKNGISTAGTLYYRVKEIEWSNASDYSRIVSVSTDAQTTRLSVYPNPVNHSATISFTLTAQGTISLKLVDLKGALLWQTEYHALTGQNELPLTAISNLPDGLYFLQYNDGLKPQIIKLLVNH